MSESRKLSSLGFRKGTSSVHTSRTMMLSELSLILEHVGPKAKADDYITAVVEQNVLGKPTQTTRKRTAQRLMELYSLDQTRPIFRLLCNFWTRDILARPLLAYLAAATRDALLRDMSPFVVAIPANSAVSASQVADHLKERYPARFKPTTLLSTAQNLASTWTQAGFLTGKVNKKRSRPVVTPVVVAFALILGYLSGIRGKLLLDTLWTRMLDLNPIQIAELAAEASRQGWLSYKGAGSIVEIGFPGLLTSQEEKASHDLD